MANYIIVIFLLLNLLTVNKYYGSPKDIGEKNISAISSSYPIPWIWIARFAGNAIISWATGKVIDSAVDGFMNRRSLTRLTRSSINNFNDLKRLNTMNNSDIKRIVELEKQFNRVLEFLTDSNLSDQKVKEKLNRLFNYDFEKLDDQLNTVNYKLSYLENKYNDLDKRVNGLYKDVEQIKSAVQYDPLHFKKYDNYFSAGLINSWVIDLENSTHDGFELAYQYNLNKNLGFIISFQKSTIDISNLAGFPTDSVFISNEFIENFYYGRAITLDWSNTFLSLGFNYNLFNPGTNFSSQIGLSLGYIRNSITYKYEEIVWEDPKTKILDDKGNISLNGRFDFAFELPFFRKLAAYFSSTYVILKDDLDANKYGFDVNIGNIIWNFAIGIRYQTRINYEKR